MVDLRIPQIGIHQYRLLPRTQGPAQAQCNRCRAFAGECAGKQQDWVARQINYAENVINDRVIQAERNALYSPRQKNTSFVCGTLPVGQFSWAKVWSRSENRQGQLFLYVAGHVEGVFQVLAYQRQPERE